MSESKEQQHSPLPWHRAVKDWWIIVAKDGARIADCVVALGMTLEEQQENARLIVRAVNSHNALVEALRPFANTPLHHFEQGHAGIASGCPECGPVLRAMNALALAEKES